MSSFKTDADKRDNALASMRETFANRPSDLSEADQRVWDEYLNDETYLRYLRARNFDVLKATNLLKASLAWRREFDVHGLCKENNSHDILMVENSTGKLYARGTDKSGHVILYMKPRHENTNNHDGNCKHLVYNLERAITTLKHFHGRLDNGHTPNHQHNYDGKITLLIDYLGFSLRNSPPMKTSMAVLSILQNHYPERLFRAYIIRPPWVFSTFWSMISPFVDPVTKEKIVFVGPHDEAGIRARLAADIDVEVIEKSLGGDDHREFDSGIYLNAPFHYDFLAALSHNEGAVPSTSHSLPAASEATDDTSGSN